MSRRPLASPLRVFASTADQHRTVCEDCDCTWHRVFAWRWMHSCAKLRVMLYTDGFFAAESLDELNAPKLQLVQEEASAA